jgi:hypothetical protein
MGKKGKKLRSDAKKLKKKAEKARNKAYYEGLRLSGNNSKRDKNKKKKGKGKRSGDKGKHLIHNCGNIGCQKCYPEDRKKVTVLNKRETRDLIKKLFPIQKKKLQRGQKVTKANKHLLAA